MAAFSGLYLFQLLSELPWLGRNPSQDNLDVFLPWQPENQAVCAASVSADTSGNLS